MNAKKLAGSRIVLLLCGSFNPPTILHLRMFERARDFFQQECNCPVLEGLMSPVADNFRKKKPSLAPAIHRLQMVEFATASSSWIRADGWECQRERWYRTIEVLRHHRAQLEKRYPGHPRMRLVLLCGGDMVDSFTREDETHPSGKLWHPDHLREILADYGLVVIERVGSNARRTFQSAKLDFLHDQLHNVAIIEDQTFPNEMSSTKLREAIHAGRSIRYCTPDSVVEYINENDLYKATKAEQNDRDEWKSIGANNDKEKDESLIKI